MLKNLLNAIFLISGTAIGAGLIALPLTSINLGPAISTTIIFLMVFIAYKTSMMTIDLNDANEKSASIVDLNKNKSGIGFYSTNRRSLSIVELSKHISGQKAFLISMVSFYTLSFALLAVYFSGITNTLGSFFNFNENIVILSCGIVLFFILSLNFSTFSKLNSVLVITLLVIIASAIIQVHTKETTITLGQQHCEISEIITFLPIIFTSFGVQNICPHVFEMLNKDRKKIKVAFLIGILIPAIIYIVWNSCVFTNVLTKDTTFFEKMRNHQVSVGELIQFLCKSSENMYMEIFFKILSLFTIITSTIGIGLGLKKSIEATISQSKIVASAIVCIVPIVLCITIPNAFINILSFGGMIATVFVIFIPYYLLEKKLKRQMDFGDKLCVLFGILVVLSELSKFLF